MTGPDDTARAGLLYVVIPHPDDELEAWSMVEGNADDYVVFVLCTHGERTAMSRGAGHQPQLGEHTPQPQPWGPPGSGTVRRQRLSSFTAFLDEVSLLDPHLESGLVDHGVLTDGPSPFTLAVGRTSARVVFDGGDGTLTRAFVTAALQRTRALRETHLPVSAERAVVGAAYWNDLPGSVRYVHPDHRAVHEALWHTDQGVPGPQWCRTASVDPDATLARQITPAMYEALMGIAPDGWRTGLFQDVYGWLGPPQGWAAGETDATAVFSRTQSFWQRRP